MRIRVRIEGRVQGVGFRWWTRNQAQSLGLRGTVRNLRDGAVEAELEGEEDAVSAMERQLERGPPGAVVERLVPLEPGDGELPVRFQILH